MTRVESRRLLVSAVGTNQQPETSVTIGLCALLRRGVSGAFVVMVIGAGLGFIAHLAVARLTGKAEYGIYALMLSWVSLLATVAQAGQDTNVVRFLPTYLLRGEWGKARGLRRGVGTLVFGISVFIALAGCAVVAVVGATRPVGWRETFFIGFAMLPLITQLQQSGAMHRAFKRAVASGIYVAVVRPAGLLALLGVAWLLGQRVDAPIAAAASAAAAAIALAATAWHLSRGWPTAARGAKPQYELNRWARTGMQLSLLSIVIVAGNRLDVLIVGGMLGAADVGPYYAAVQIAEFALYGVQAVNVILAPLIAERFDADDLAGLRTLVRRAARIGFVGALAASLVIGLVGRWVLGLFGPGFESAYVPLLILLAGYCATSAFGEVGFLMSMTRYQLHTSIFVAIGILANALVAWLLVPRLGVMGVAIGAVASLVVWRGFALLFVIRRLNVNPAVVGRIGTSAVRL